MSWLSVSSPWQTIRRCLHYKRFVSPGAVKYPGGIKYYPRFPDEKEPEITPSKLFRVERIKKIKYTTRIERQILTNFKIGAYTCNVTILKNIPEVNSSLWRIKHLVKITPITFPHGEPTANDINYTVLKENGECIVKKELFISPEKIEPVQKYLKSPTRVDGTTIQKNCRKKWMNGWTGGF